MPELPEVETIRRGLEKFVVGYTIADVEVRLAKQFHGDKGLVAGAAITGVRRFGKGLLIDLSNGYSLAIHVKMTGQLLYQEQLTVNNSQVTSEIQLPNKHTHVIFSLTVNSQLLTVKKAQLFYNDLRQFGWIKIVKTDEAQRMVFFKGLGREPLKDLTLYHFSSLLSARKTPIKLLLMDQAKIAGIGNIYANDALYRSNIHPIRPASSLSLEETRRLFRAIEEVLQKGIDAGGASEWHYVDVTGGKGSYQNFFLVYGQAGKTCKRCGSIIERMKVGGRGTFFCPTCQVLP